MNLRHSKRHQHEQEQATQTGTEQQQAAREFQQAEEVIRFDAGQHPVPSRVEQRLQESVEREGIRPPRPWWKRFLGQ